MSIWTAARYGWSPIYYLTIEGIPVVWAEAALGLTLPTGYTAEAAALHLESAAIGVEQVDRQRGVAVTAGSMIPFDSSIGTFRNLRYFFSKLAISSLFLHDKSNVSDIIW